MTLAFIIGGVLLVTLVAAGMIALTPAGAQAAARGTERAPDLREEAEARASAEPAHR
jgi:hypothetical protein